MVEINGNIEDIFPLTPNQETVLIRSLMRAESDDAILTVSCDLRGAVDADVIAARWTQACERRAVLRTSVHWENIARPVQVVHSDVTTSLDRVDLRATSPDQREYVLSDRIQSLKENAIDLNTAPTVRCVLARLDDDSWRLTLICHHVLLDGWSAGMVLGDLLSGHRGDDSNQSSTFKDYVKWIASRSQSDKEFWRGKLAQVQSSCLVGEYGGTNSRQDPKYVERILEESVVDGFRSWLRDRGITPGTYIAGAWALTLSRYLGEREVTFALTTSGRPPEIPGIEEMAGLFSTSVPIHTVPDAATFNSMWLTELQRQIHTAIQHQCVGPAQISECFPASVRARPFDTLLTVENYPTVALNDAETFNVERMWGDVQSAYPVTVVVVPGSRYKISLAFNPSMVDDDEASSLCEIFSRVLKDRVSGIRGVQPVKSRDRRAVPHVESRTKRSADRDSQPSSGIEIGLIDLWRRTLGVAPSGVHDNFFDSGGTSVLAAQFFDRIERKFGKRLPLAALLSAPTIRGLSGLIGSGDFADRWRALVPINSDGHKPPIFCVHAAGGNVLGYKWLSKALGQDQPFYALQAIGLNEDEPPHETVGDMARHYLTEIRSVQPAGPYYLLGHCFGSKVVFEMAHELRASGEAVGLLCVLDSEPPPIADSVRPNDVQVDSEQPLGLMTKLLRHARTGRAPIVAANFLKERLLGAMASKYRRRYTVRAANRRAARRYVGKFYDGNVLLIRSSESLAEAYHDNLAEGWKAISKQVRTHVVEGGHRTILTNPHVREVAKLINENLPVENKSDSYEAVSTSRV